jgi:hypothetical protein
MGKKAENIKIDSAASTDVRFCSKKIDKTWKNRLHRRLQMLYKCHGDRAKYTHYANLYVSWFLADEQDFSTPEHSLPCQSGLAVNLNVSSKTFRDRTKISTVLENCRK